MTKYILCILYTSFIYVNCSFNNTIEEKIIQESCHSDINIINNSSKDIPVTHKHNIKSNYLYTSLFRCKNNILQYEVNTQYINLQDCSSSNSKCVTDNYFCQNENILCKSMLDNDLWRICEYQYKNCLKNYSNIKSYCKFIQR
jgi:hypothetical protein